MTLTIDKQAVRGGPFADFFANGVRVHDTLYLAGAVSMDETGAVVGAGDLITQFRQAYANIEAVLAEFGADMTNIVDEAVYVTDFPTVMANLDGLAALRNEVFGGPVEATQTMVQVAGLVDPDLLVEVKCVARL